MTSPSLLSRTMAGRRPAAKTKKWTWRVGDRVSAGARRSLHVSEMAQQQPGGKRANEIARALEPQPARSNRVCKRHGARPHTRDRAGVGTGHDVDVEAGILQADVGAFAREDQPARLEAAAPRRKGPEVEANDHTARRQLRKV